MENLIIILLIYILSPSLLTVHFATGSPPPPHISCAY